MSYLHIEVDHRCRNDIEGQRVKICKIRITRVGDGKRGGGRQGGGGGGRFLFTREIESARWMTVTRHNRGVEDPLSLGDKKKK